MNVVRRCFDHEVVRPLKRHDILISRADDLVALVKLGRFERKFFLLRVISIHIKAYSRQELI